MLHKEPISGVVLSLVCMTAAADVAKVTAQDYARAERFLPWNKPQYVINADIRPRWIGAEDRFWYQRTDGSGKKQFVIVDAASGRRTAAFDHEAIAAAFSAATNSKIDAGSLPFESFRYAPDKRSIEFKAKNSLWICQLRAAICGRKPLDNDALTWSTSPDGRWAAYLKGPNLWVRSTDGSQQEFPLTTDGVARYGYAQFSGDSTHPVTDLLHPKPTPPQVIWSPDSKYIATYRLDERQVRDLHLIQSVPKNKGIRPQLHSFPVALPGDEVIVKVEPLLFDVMTRRRIALQIPAFEGGEKSIVERRDAWWSRDGGKLFFLVRDRYGRSVTLHEAQPDTGRVREVLRESNDTALRTGDQAPSSNPLVRTLSNGDVVWFSERDGWGHLYRYDGKTGRLRNPITHGDWLVRDIIRLDEASSTIYFMASGREAGRDPYEQRMYRVSLDGSDLRLLTPEEAEHTVRPSAPVDGFPVDGIDEQGFSPSGRYFIDTYSRPDLPPVLALRAANGRLVRELERADISKLRQGGYVQVEPVKVLAADGKTDIYGNLFRPSTFDPGRRYPVIDATYPGPQMTRTGKTFGAALFGAFEAQSLAELGFIVVTLDGRGTPHRAKQFLDHSYGRLDKASDLQDHIAGIRQLARRYPFMDLNRVGIDGVSGGGFLAARALLTYPEFYKVAVAAAGNHDQASYNRNWGEIFIGDPAKNDYAASSNLPLASNLQGKLLLMHGEMDDNVLPTQTLQLADALIKANKDFDLLIIPNGNHYAFLQPYFIRRKWDFFVRHLLGVEPPLGYTVKPPSPSPNN